MESLAALLYSDQHVKLSQRKVLEEQDRRKRLLLQVLSAALLVTGDALAQPQVQSTHSLGDPAALA